MTAFGEGVQPSTIAMTPSGETWERHEVPHLDGNLILRPGATAPLMGLLAITAATFGREFQANKEVFTGANAMVTNENGLAVKIFKPWGIPGLIPAEWVDGLTAARALATFEEGIARYQARIDDQVVSSRYRFTTPEFYAAFVSNERPKSGMLKYTDSLRTRSWSVHIASFEEGTEALLWHEGVNIPDPSERKAVYDEATRLAGAPQDSIDYDDNDGLGAPSNILWRPYGSRDSKVTEIVKYDVMARDALARHDFPVSVS